MTANPPINPKDSLDFTMKITLFFISITLPFVFTAEESKQNFELEEALALVDEQREASNLRGDSGRRLAVRCGSNPKTTLSISIKKKDRKNNLIKEKNGYSFYAPFKQKRSTAKGDWHESVTYTRKKKGENIYIGQIVIDFNDNSAIFLGDISNQNQIPVTGGSGT
jgi:hypothetical protein